MVVQQLDKLSIFFKFQSMTALQATESALATSFSRMLAAVGDDYGYGCCCGSADWRVLMLTLRLLSLAADGGSGGWQLLRMRRRLLRLTAAADAAPAVTGSCSCSFSCGSWRPLLLRLAAASVTASGGCKMRLRPRLWTREERAFRTAARAAGRDGR